MAMHFSKALPEISRLSQSQQLLFCLDFDGTLVPIRRDPEKVKPSSSLLRFFKKAVKLPHCRVVIVSGRSLKFLKSRIAIPGITLVGSHGLEWNLKRKRDVSRSRILKQIQKKWKERLKGVKGFHFEDKPFSFVLHYRRCPQAQQKIIIDFFATQQASLVKKGIEWTVAHKAFEVFESARGRKEHVSRDLLQQFKGARMIVAGDDVTDFEMLTLSKKQGWAVTVGLKSAGIKYFANGPGEFVRLLNQIISKRAG